MRWLVSLLVGFLLVQATASAVAVEVLYVQGCARETEPRRATMGCFRDTVQSASADFQSNLTLTIRGLHFPVFSSDEPPPFRVWLEESVPPPLLLSASEEAMWPPSSQRSESRRLRMECRHVKGSTVFPSQLLTCDLPHPHTVLAAEDRALRERLRYAAMWMDLLLEWTPMHAGEAAETVFCRHRLAVELDLRPSTAATAAAAKDREDTAVPHPVERLLDPTRATGAEDAESGWAEMGIGGLQRELRVLLRRVFLSRMPSLGNITSSLGVQHVRGVLLYGPPGNGKTLIARSMLRLLGPEVRLTVINAADVLSKYIGESEKNLRDAFAGYTDGASEASEEDPRHEMPGDSDAKATGLVGRLHVLIIDEFDALFRRRGHSTDESSAKAVYDGITNTLLSLMDGFENRNDMLVIGLTNRLQAIDSALLRPGRFEVLIEIPIPDLPAREEIFFIHTERMREEGYLDAGVDLRALALHSGGFSGSDIAGATRAALSYAMLRFREDHAAGTASAPGAFHVTQMDFTRALRDIQTTKEEISSVTYLLEDQSGFGKEMVDHDGKITDRIEAARHLIDRVTRSHRTYAGVVAISGASGTGKSLMARQLVGLHPFSTVRFLACRRLVELSEVEEQLLAVQEALSEASRTEVGIVVLDDLDVLLESLARSRNAESTLKSLLYQFTQHRRGVGRRLHRGMPGNGLSATPENSAGAAQWDANLGSRIASDSNRRFLVFTTTQSHIVREHVHDLHIPVRPLKPKGVQTLLAHYRIVGKKLSSRPIVAALPPSLSFRNFLRITDRALWTLRMEHSGEEEEDAGGLPASFVGNPDEMSWLKMASRQSESEYYFLNEAKEVSQFALAVHEAVEDMGIGDAFREWYHHRDGMSASAMGYEEGVNEVDNTAEDL